MGTENLPAIQSYRCDVRTGSDRDWGFCDAGKKAPEKTVQVVYRRNGFQISAN
jgi:hypothetical protein